MEDRPPDKLGFLSNQTIGKVNMIESLKTDNKVSLLTVKRNET